MSKKLYCVIGFEEYDNEHEIVGMYTSKQMLDNAFFMMLDRKFVGDTKWGYKFYEVFECDRNSNKNKKCIIWYDSSVDLITYIDDETKTHYKIKRYDDECSWVNGRVKEKVLIKMPIRDWYERKHLEMRKRRITL